MLTKRAKYAVQALILLAKNSSGELVRIETLAEKGKFPRKFLESILLDLKNGGLLHSRKGRSGGYHLAVPPSQIPVGEVLRLVDGPMAPISCVSKTAYAPCQDCPDIDACAIRMVMCRAHEASLAILDSTYLSDLIEFMDDAARPNPNSLMYYI